MRSFVTLSTACAGLFVAQTLTADVVETQDGSRLNGEIIRIHEGTLVLETSFAGELKIGLDEVVSFSSEDPENVRFADGTVAVGPVQGDGLGQITITGPSGTVSGSTDKVIAAWAPGDRDPIVLAREAELEGQLRQWSYEAAVALTGRYGNTEKNDYAASAKATLEGPNDRLQFYVGWLYADTDGVRSTDEIVGGVSYTNFFSEKFGWYVREELERDQFENIDFRSTTAAGLNYRAINKKTQKLELTAGLSLRYEGYTDPALSGGLTDESFPGLDFGVKHYWKFADWGEMNNSITYNPTFADFGDYRLDHLSTVDIPLGTVDYWKVRFSLQNQYNSGIDEATGAEKLDTTYAISLLLNWK